MKCLIRDCGKWSALLFDMTTYSALHLDSTSSFDPSVYQVICSEVGMLSIVLASDSLSSLNSIPGMVILKF